jgi:Tfp pilus assembly protein PilO
MTYGWWFYLLHPTQVHSGELLSELHALRQMQDDATVVLTEYEMAKEQLQHWKQLDSIRLERCADRPNDSDFLHWIHQQADQYGLIVRDFRPLQRDKLEDYETRSVSIAGQGSYEAVCQFLNCFCTSPRMNRVTSFEITSADGKDSFSLTMQVALYSIAASVPANRTSGPQQ